LLKIAYSSSASFPEPQIEVLPHPNPGSKKMYPLNRLDALTDGVFGAAMSLLRKCQA
jgi:hypothetical protein